MGTARPEPGSAERTKGNSEIKAKTRNHAGNIAGGMQVDRRPESVGGRARPVPDHHGARLPDGRDRRGGLAVRADLPRVLRHARPGAGGLLLSGRGGRGHPPHRRGRAGGPDRMREPAHPHAVRDQRRGVLREAHGDRGAHRIRLRAGGVAAGGRTPGAHPGDGRAHLARPARPATGPGASVRAPCGRTPRRSRRR